MSLIEQAANRLEQLRKAGVEIPGEDQAPPRQAEAAPTPRPPPAPAASSVRPAKVGEGRAKSVAMDLDMLGRSGFITPKSPRAQNARLPLASRPS